MTSTDLVTGPQSLTLRYLATVQELLDRAVCNQQVAIDRAAQAIADSLAQGGLLHLFGTGHSHLLVEELYGRAGSLTPVNAILVPRLMLHEDMVASTLLERQEDLAGEVLADQPLQTGDVMLVISNSGRNGLSIEVARLARQKKLTVIVLTAVEYSRTLSSRHSSGRHLFEVADIVLDNYGQPGDACLEIPGVTIKTGPTSTIVGATLLNAVMAEAVARLKAMGLTPPLLISANLAGPDDSQSLAVLGSTGRRLSHPAHSGPAQSAKV